jgi:hypothetical protein
MRNARQQSGGFNQWNLRLRCAPTFGGRFQSAGRIHWSENNFRSAPSEFTGAFYYSCCSRSQIRSRLFTILDIPLDWAAAAMPSAARVIDVYCMRRDFCHSD